MYCILFYFLLYNVICHLGHKLKPEIYLGFLFIFLSFYFSLCLKLLPVYSKMFEKIKQTTNQPTNNGNKYIIVCSSSSKYFRGCTILMYSCWKMMKCLSFTLSWTYIWTSNNQGWFFKNCYLWWFYLSHFVFNLYYSSFNADLCD